MTKQHDVCLSLGSNLEPKLTHLANALALLGKLGKESKVSSVYETSPVLEEQDPDHPVYFNLIFLQKTSLDLEAYHQQCMTIEKRLGRFRAAGVISRTLDIDIISFGDQHGTFGSVTVPHPRASSRRFVMAPLAEVWPDWRVQEGAPTAREIDQELKADESQAVKIVVSSEELLEEVRAVSGS